MYGCYATKFFPALSYIFLFIYASQNSQIHIVNVPYIAFEKVDVFVRVQLYIFVTIFMLVENYLILSTWSIA